MAFALYPINEFYQFFKRLILSEFILNWKRSEGLILERRRRHETLQFKNIDVIWTEER
jgi:hypothetical protein